MHVCVCAHNYRKVNSIADISLSLLHSGKVICTSAGGDVIYTE